MSLAVLYSRALAGMDAPLVTVEVHLAPGLPSFTIVGLPEAEVKESKDRVRAALQNARFDFPARRVTVNLAPADLPKESGRFDLPIALGILAASGQLPHDRLQKYEFAGELALTGDIRTIRGALAMTYKAARSGRGFVVPADNAAEAALVEQADVLPAKTLLQVFAHLTGQDPIPAFRSPPPLEPERYADLADVKGQLQAKRALEIAAAGGHNLLLVGPPGTGKSMLASRFPGLLPEMAEAEALESAALQSLGTAGFDVRRWKQRPYRAPHHTASSAALVGGGSHPRPGEISLAHHGVLFLDELPEFDRKVLEVLREPLETGTITISRAARQVSFPARFQLIAAMNPTPSGYRENQGRMRDTPEQVARYQAKISGPLLDRIDLQIEVPALSPDELMRSPAGESSSQIRARVIAARARQIERQQVANAHLGTSGIDHHIRLQPQGETLLRNAIEKMGLSARGYHRILKVARTIADLADSTDVTTQHIAEAIQYRRFDLR